MNKKLKIIIIVACTVLVCAGTVVTTFVLVNNHREQQRLQYINEVLANIDEHQRLFNEVEDRIYRVHLHESLLRNHADFIDSEFESEEITLRYSTVLNGIEDYFFNYYSNEIERVANGDKGDPEDFIIYYSGKIEGLNLVKSWIITDGIFNSNAIKQLQLNEKADEYVNYFTKTNDWLNRIGEISNLFDSTERIVKLDVFTEIISMITEYEENSFKNEDAADNLESLVVSTTLWFFNWYIDMIEELSVCDIEEPGEELDEEDVEETDNIDEKCEEECEEDCEDECNVKEVYYFLIIAMIGINDLIDMFNIEHEVIFNNSTSSFFLNRFNEVLLGNLITLEEIGVDIINSRNYRKEATDKAIELYLNLYEEWKKDHRDNEHIQTYPELLREAFKQGRVEHEKILEQERQAREAAARARQQRTGSSSGGFDGGNSESGSPVGNNSAGGFVEGQQYMHLGMFCGYCGANLWFTFRNNAFWQIKCSCDDAQDVPDWSKYN